MGPLHIERRFSDKPFACGFGIAQALAKQPAQALSFGIGLSGDFAPFRKAGIPTLNFRLLPRRLGRESPPSPR